MLAWLWTRLSDGSPQVSIAGRALRRFPEREVERLLRARVLIEHSKADSWSVCAHCDCGLDVRPIRQIGDELRACCPHDAAEDVVLEDGDLTWFGVDANRLAGQIGASGGLAGPVSAVLDGVWTIGSGPAGRVLMLCSSADRLEAPGAILALKSAAAPRPLTVIAKEPEPALMLRLREAGIEVRELADVIKADPVGVDRLILDDGCIPTGGVRLVLHRQGQFAVLDGRRLDLAPTDVRSLQNACRMVGAARPRAQGAGDRGAVSANTARDRQRPAQGLRHLRALGRVGRNACGDRPVARVPPWPRAVRGRHRGLSAVGHTPGTHQTHANHTGGPAKAGSLGASETMFRGFHRCIPRFPPPTLPR